MNQFRDSFDRFLKNALGKNSARNKTTKVEIIVSMITAKAGLKNFIKKGSNKVAVFNPTKTREIVLPMSIAPIKFEGLDIRKASHDAKTPPLFDSILTCSLLALKNANSIPEKKAERIRANNNCMKSIIFD
jgi:hypothetical protein